MRREAMHHKKLEDGNLGDVDNNTYCWSCGTILIDRSSYSLNILMTKNKCPKCDSTINIVLGV